MDELAREFADRAHFLFVYVREAHPDDFPDHPAHRSFEQKLQHARDLQQRFDTPRPILVDSLDGHVHRMYGSAPNMSWIIDPTGHVAFKGGWTTVEDLRPALEAVIHARELKRRRMRLIPYYKEMISYRWRTQAGGRGELSTIQMGTLPPPEDEG